MAPTQVQAQVEGTGQLGQNVPGYDAAPAIATAEQGLLDFLATPIQQVLGGLPLQQFPQEPPRDPQESANAPDLSGFDPFQLISPVLNGLGALGTGQFSGADPTQALRGVADAFDGTAMPMNKAIGDMSHDWQGRSGTAADAKARAAVADGAQVANQADGLRSNLSTAAGNVAQARASMIDIIDQYNANIAAIGPDIDTPAGRQAAVAAANQAVNDSTAVMTDLQGTLGTQAGEVSAMGAPVGITGLPEVGSMLGGIPGVGGALKTVFSDPRLTPEGIAGNFMDLFFLPSTVTELNQGIKTTNSVIGNTNSIMSGLGSTLQSTNGTIGKTNSIMTGLGSTLESTNGTIGRTNSIMTGLGSSLGSATSAINSTNAALGGATAAINNTTSALGTTNENLGTVNDTMGETNTTMGDVNETMGTTNETMGETNSKMDDLNDGMGDLHDGLGETNEQMNELNESLPGPFGTYEIPGTPVPAPR